MTSPFFSRKNRRRSRKGSIFEKVVFPAQRRGDNNPLNSQGSITRDCAVWNVKALKEKVILALLTLAANWWSFLVVHKATEFSLWTYFNAHIAQNCCWMMDNLGLRCMQSSLKYYIWKCNRVWFETPIILSITFCRLHVSGLQKSKWIVMLQITQ